MTYTFVMEFADGTYVSQRNAKNEYEAFKRWLRRNPCPRGMSDHVWRELRQSIRDNHTRPTLLAKVKRVWQVSGSAHAAMNIVRTAYVTIVRTA